MNPNQSQQNNDSQLQPLAAAVTRALAYTENGGAPDISNPSAGKTGEMKSIFQYEPETWKADAGKILGDPNAPLTPDNETHVANQMVLGMLKKGMTVSQIASTWNAGPGEPDAYTGKFSDGSPSVGTNKDYGVKYDVPGYAKKVLAYTKEFMGGGSQDNQQPQYQTPTLDSNLPLKKAITMIQKANQNPKKNSGKYTPASSGLFGKAFQPSSTAKQ